MSTPKPLILFFNPVRHALATYRALSKVARTELLTSTSRNDFFNDLKGKYEDVNAIYRTSASGAVVGNFDEDFINHLPPTLKYICHTGAGYDQIDVAACKARDIIVTYAPDPVTKATADLTIFLLLGALRQANSPLNGIRTGRFKENVKFGNDPQGKTLGILGMGRIGKEVKRRVTPFGLRVIYHSRKELPASETEGATYVSFDQLISESDIISIHVPLSRSTRHLIGAEDIKKMKHGVVIINTARGAIIDEAAMAQALEEGRIGAVGLDVYEREPHIHEQLLENERAFLTPHIGTHTVETLAQMEELAMENARRGITGEKLLTPVPEMVINDVD